MREIKPREDRLPLIIPARMLAEAGWQDVTVCNVSSRGMMLRCSTPPKRNSFIEVRHKEHCFVGRVIWSSGTQFGIRTQDKVDYLQLISPAPPYIIKAGPERRTRPRNDKTKVSVRVLPPEESSRIFARLFDFSVLAVALALGAIMLADVVGVALEPLGGVEVALSNARAAK